MNIGRRVGPTMVALLVAGVVVVLLGPPIAGIAIGLREVIAGRFERPAMLEFRGVDAGVTTAVWAMAIGGVGSILGLGVGRRLAMRRRPLEAAFWTVPVLLAPAMLFDAWWLEAGPDSMLGGWAAVHGQVPLVRQGVLGLGLLGHALPLAVWAHAAGGQDPARSLRLMDRPRFGRRLLAWWRIDGPAVIRVGVLLAILIAGLTVPFDLAQVRSIGFELRTLDNRGAGMGTLLRAGWWAIPISVLAAVMLTRRVARSGRGDRAGTVLPPPGPWIGLAVGVVIVLVPLMLLSRRAWQVDQVDAWRLHGPAAFGTLRMAAMGGVFGAVIAGGCAMLRGWGGGVARSATLVVAGAALVAIMPATLVAVGVESVWNRPVTADIYDGPIAMTLAVVGRIAVVPAVIGCILVPRIGFISGGPLATDSPVSPADLWMVLRPIAVRALICGGLAGGVLAASEIPVTARLQPPGFPMLSTATLNAMHYQYVDSVLPVVLPISLAAIPVALLLSRMSRSGAAPVDRLGRGHAAWLLMSTLLLTFGCDPGDGRERASDGPTPIECRAMFGRPGNLEGRFDYPRAVAIDPANERVFVVDKSARIQRFALDGTFQTSWRMPRFENGKPTGLSLAPDGRLLVADTHEHRVTIFSPDGDLLATHGRMGRGPGEFIYPTDIAAGPDGRWFVSEYGGNDRIQIFDAEWNPIGVIGMAGERDEGDRPALSRPQSIAWDRTRAELFIADAIHHRIVVTDAEGRLRRVLGGPGLEPGRFSYPYGVGIDEDGTLIVVEFGANRVQRIDAETGRCLAVAGGTGVEAGRLRYPWAIDVAQGLMAVLDSGNARVLIGDPPRVGSGLEPSLDPSPDPATSPAARPDAQDHSIP